MAVGSEGLYVSSIADPWSLDCSVFFSQESFARVQ
jgi:hypothetical protein